MADSPMDHGLLQRVVKMDLCFVGGGVGKGRTNKKGQTSVNKDLMLLQEFARPLFPPSSHSELPTSSLVHWCSGVLYGSARAHRRPNFCFRGT